MEERKTIFDYLGQIFMMYGISIALMCVFCVLFGEGAKKFSSMFALGKEGLNITTMVQFLLMSACITGIRFLFFTDVIIKKMSLTARTVWMVISVLLVAAGFIMVCDWFPADMWRPWLMFLICFGVCFIVSMSITILKERMENKKMEEALERLKKEEK
ncbi:MAG: hypothetical protein J6B68_12985 [Lachnospiraceae bacterium]|nr:hypothetical protein [Lachnospiraceae bacterium]